MAWCMLRGKGVGFYCHIGGVKRVTKHSKERTKGFCGARLKMKRENKIKYPYFPKLTNRTFLKLLWDSWRVLTLHWHAAEQIEAWGGWSGADKRWINSIFSTWTRSSVVTSRQKHWCKFSFVIIRTETSDQDGEGAFHKSSSWNRWPGFKKKKLIK